MGALEIMSECGLLKGSFLLRKFQLFSYLLFTLLRLQMHCSALWLYCIHTGGLKQYLWITSDPASSMAAQSYPILPWRLYGHSQHSHLVHCTISPTLMSES